MNGSLALMASVACRGWESVWFYFEGLSFGLCLCRRHTVDETSGILGQLPSCPYLKWKSGTFFGSVTVGTWDIAKPLQ